MGQDNVEAVNSMINRFSKEPEWSEYNENDPCTINIREYWKLMGEGDGLGLLNAIDLSKEDLVKKEDVKENGDESKLAVDKRKIVINDLIKKQLSFKLAKLRAETGFKRDLLL